jgi:ubiquinone/menaquinone biosynthesis C-methylase UbiE
MMADEIAIELGICELRKIFLRYTKAAVAGLSLPQRPRILDIGCGWGASTVELARLTKGSITGIDVDTSSIEGLRQRVKSFELEDRVEVMQRSLLSSGFPDASFHLLVEEGVLHILETKAALAECARLLAPGGQLLSCETLVWFDSVQEELAQAGFSVVARLPWKPGCWWDEYYRPLERRVNALRKELEDRGEDPTPLERYEREISMVKKDVSATDCLHALLVRV